MHLQKYRDRHARCIAILFRSIGVWGRLYSPDVLGMPKFHIWIAAISSCSMIKSFDIAECQRNRDRNRVSKSVEEEGKINSVQTRCIVKGEAQKNPLFWWFSGGFWFSQDRLFFRNSTRKPLNLIKSPIFANAPCKTTCLYNAPSMHTVDKNHNWSRSDLNRCDSKSLAGWIPNR